MVRRYSFDACLLTAVFSMVFTLQASAASIHIDYTGTLTSSATRADQTSIFHIGDSVSGSMDIDLDTPIGSYSPAFGKENLASYFSAITNSTLTVNGVPFAYSAAGSQDVQLRDYIGPLPGPTDPPDQGDVTALFSTGQNAGIVATPELFFYDQVTNADAGYTGPFTGTALTVDKFNFSAFGSSLHTIATNSPDGPDDVTLHLTSIALSPEPAMLSVWLGASVFLVRRREHSSRA